MQLISRTLLRTFQAQIAKKIRTFGSGSASAKKNDVLTKKESVFTYFSLGDKIFKVTTITVYM